MPDDKNKPASGFQFGLTNLKPVESSKIALTFPDGAKREFTKKHHRPRYRQGHLAVAGQAHGGDGAGWRGL